MGLQAFYDAAANGTLPEVSFIVGPQELSEHPPYMPKDGAWLQKQVVDAVVKSPKYSSTLLMISYDGTALPYISRYLSFHGKLTESSQRPAVLATTSPLSILLKIRQAIGCRTLMESLAISSLAQVSGSFEFAVSTVATYLTVRCADCFTLKGFRLPFYMISPWTRGNRVFTERADHNSQILFVEQWLTAKGYKNVQTDQMVDWRRGHMSNLVNALDLDHVG